MLFFPYYVKSNVADAGLTTDTIEERAVKFKMPFEVLVHNTNFFTKYAALDQCIDETSIAYGGCGAFITNLRGKICSRGAQIVVLLDHATRQLRGFLPRHKYNNKEEGFTQEGPSEVAQLIKTFVDPNIGDGKIWPTKPHFTCNNYFTSLPLAHWIGKRGYKLTGTLAKNNLIPGIKKEYFHSKATHGELTLLFIYQFRQTAHTCFICN